MKVFVAGATGAVGRRLVPALLEKGYEVTAMTRSRDKARALRDAGVRAVIADALDRDAVVEAIRRAAPEVVVHQLTDLAGITSLRNFDDVFASTNRLRSEGTDNLLAGARAAGARRIVAQSYGSWIYSPSGRGLRTEHDLLDPAPLSKQRRTLDAIRYLEDVTTEARDITGIALRYGSFYGPGTGLAADGDLVALVRRRRLPVIGAGSGVWSFIHVDDAASAAIAAIERGAAGVYNVCDDEPARVADWLPALAAAIDAPPPPHVPAWLGRLAAGEVTVAMMTRIPGMSNEKAKRELGWTPAIASWREGFRTALGDAAVHGARAA